MDVQVKEALIKALIAAIVGIAALIIVLLIYIIKSKYKQKNVSSTFIWKRSLKYLRRRIPINFIMSVVLIVQIIVVVIATLALSDIKTKPAKSQASIIIVDASASMKATNGNKSRYDIAIDMIRAKAENVKENAAMSIILAGETSQVLTKTTMLNELTDKEEEFHYVYTRDRALEIINSELPGKCTNVETDINQALEEAKTALRQNKEAKIYLYTDRYYDYNDVVEVINCADPENDWNAGITSFTDTLLAAGYEYTANIVNKGADAEFEVTLTVDGAHVATKKISMKAGTTKQVVFSPKSTENSEEIKIQSIKKYDKAQIKINTGADVLSDDNIAYLTSVPQADLKVLYVSDKVKVTAEGAVDRTYQTHLHLSLGASGLVINSTDIYHKDQVKTAPKIGYDLYIYEGVMPDSMPSDGAVWFINAPSSPVGTNIVFSGDSKNSSTDGGNGYNIKKNGLLGTIGQQLSSNVHFEDGIKIVYNGELREIKAAISKMSVIGTINYDDAKLTLAVPDNFEVVYNAVFNIKTTSGEIKEIETPVMLAGMVGTARTIVTTFDFQNTSLPLFISDYPVLLKNMINFSMPDILPDRTPTIGDTLQFNAPAGVESITYYYKSYDTQVLEDKEGKSTYGNEVIKWNQTDSAEPPEVVLDKHGIYSMVVKYKPQITVDEDGKLIENVAETDAFSVSTYMSLSESDITARGPKLEVPLVTDGTKNIIRTPILWVFVLFLLIAIVIEWGVYYRDEH